MQSCSDVTPVWLRNKDESIAKNRNPDFSCSSFVKYRRSDCRFELSYLYGMDTFEKASKSIQHKNICTKHQWWKGELNFRYYCYKCRWSESSNNTCRVFLTSCIQRSRHTDEVTYWLRLISWLECDIMNIFLMLAKCLITLDHASNYYDAGSSNAFDPNKMLFQDGPTSSITVFFSWHLEWVCMVHKAFASLHWQMRQKKKTPMKNLKKIK